MWLYYVHLICQNIRIWSVGISGGLCGMWIYYPQLVSKYMYIWYGFLSGGLCLLSRLRPYVVCGYIIHNWSLNICTYNVASFLVVNCLLSGLRPYVVCGYIYTQLVCRYIHMMWVHFWWYMVCGYIIYNWSVDMYIWCGFISCGLWLLTRLCGNSWSMIHLRHLAFIGSFWALWLYIQRLKRAVLQNSHFQLESDVVRFMSDIRQRFTNNRFISNIKLRHFKKWHP